MWFIEFSSKGMGTQQIEEHVSALFPEVEVARMDWDTTRGSGLSKLIQFLPHKAKFWLVPK